MLLRSLQLIVAGIFSLAPQQLKMSKRVALVNGIVRMKGYNAILKEKYASLGYETAEHKFPTHLLFCCHRHGKLESTVEKIVNESDVVHCQSSGFFPVLPYMTKNKVQKPLIMESPVLISHTGTLLAATNQAKHFAEPQQSAVINWMLDKFAFTPEWKAQTLKSLAQLKEENGVIVLHSSEDNVSDMRGLEALISHHWQTGRHARLFHPDTGNDFNVIKDFLANYRKENRN